MEIIEFDLHNVPHFEKGISLALGNFDGMHLGHNEVLFETLYRGEADSAILFLSPSQEAKENLAFLKLDCLMSEDDKIGFAKNKGFDYALVCHCDFSFFSLSSEEFMDKVLDKLNPKEIFCGEDYSFGNGGKGNPSLLRTRYQVHEILLLMKNSEKVSSTRIRSLIEEGNIEEAVELLGHPYQIRGLAKEGERRGTCLGFPTANLSLLDSYVLPAPGVYYGYGYVNGVAHPAIINYGNNPTFDNKAATLEAHLIGYQGLPLYNKTVYLSFLGFLRKEIRFENAEELAKQIQIDKETALRKLGVN